MKRLFDIFVSFTGIVLLSPVMIVFALFTWIIDFKNPLYIAPRVGKNGKIFLMFKLRSMIVNADKSGVDSTSNNDARITKSGKIARKLKIDELYQLINVLKGDMSLVGPRPNVKRETELYTKEEQLLLTVHPGITDFASIVFADEGSILSSEPDPDLAYNQLIRPWKSKLALFYIKNANLVLDIKLIFYTIIQGISRDIALQLVTNELKRLQAPYELIDVSRRVTVLTPTSPPGAKDIVLQR